MEREKGSRNNQFQVAIKKKEDNGDCHGEISYYDDDGDDEDVQSLHCNKYFFRRQAGEKWVHCRKCFYQYPEICSADGMALSILNLSVSSFKFIKVLHLLPFGFFSDFRYFLCLKFVFLKNVIRLLVL